MLQRDNLNHTNELTQIQRYSLLSQQTASKKQKFGLENESNKPDPANVHEVTAEITRFSSSSFCEAASYYKDLF
jgi:hypothetical protein